MNGYMKIPIMKQAIIGLDNQALQEMQPFSKTSCIQEAQVDKQFIVYNQEMKFDSKKRKQDELVIYKLKCISVVSLLFMTVEIFGGIMAHSIAILADAFHLLSDVLAYIISLQAVLLSHRKPPFFMTFGYEKVQPLGALINVSIIWFVTLELLIEATERIAHKAVVKDPLFMLLTSFFGLGCNLYIMRVLHSDVEHGGHQGCSHSHGQGLEHHHGHNHGHEHSHNGKKCSHDHGKQPKMLKMKKQKKSITKKCSHDNLDEHHHDHQHNHNHNHNCGSQEHMHQHEGHDHVHENKGQGKHVHSSSCSHHHDNDVSSADSNRQIVCDMDHDHAQDSHNCNSKGYSIVEHEAMNQQINDHISYKPDLPLMNLSDESLKIAQKQQARRQLFKNINIQAAHIHIISDIILSIGVIVSAIIIYNMADPEQWTYWQLADPFCTYLFSIMAIYSTVGIAKDSVIILLDGCDDKEMLKDIISELDGMDEVESYSELRVWSKNRAKFAAAVKIALSKEKYEDLPTRDRIRDKVSTLFSTREISHYVEVQLDKDQQQQQLKAE